MQGRVRFSCIQHAALKCYLKPSEICGLTGLIFSFQRCINLWLQSMGLDGSFRFCKSGMGYSCIRTQWYWCVSSLCVGLADMHRSLGTEPWEKQSLSEREGWSGRGMMWRLHNIRHGLREWLKVILTLLHRWSLKSEIIAKDDYFRLVSSGKQRKKNSGWVNWGGKSPPNLIIALDYKIWHVFTFWNNSKLNNN